MREKYFQIILMFKKIYNANNLVIQRINKLFTLQNVLVSLFFILVMGLSAQADDSIIVKDGIIRFMPPQSPNTGGFIKLTNTTSKDIKLLRAEGNFSESVELHDMKMEGEKMTMRPIPFINIPANSSIELKPGSLHIMFIGLKSPLKLGEDKKITLVLDNNKNISVSMNVKDMQMQMKK